MPSKPHPAAAATTWIALLRGINVGGHHKAPMELVRSVFSAAGCQDVRSYIQSGNLVFRYPESMPAPALEQHLESAFQREFGFLSSILLRDVSEMAHVVDANPFAAEAAVSPAKVSVFFLRDTPPAIPPSDLDAFGVTGEQLVLSGRHLYVHFPIGMGRSKLPFSTLGRKLVPNYQQGETVTARNWNTVLRLLEMARAA